MKIKQIICIILLSFSLLWSQSDSSDLIFLNLELNTFYLQFYSNNWEEQLKMNYEIEEFIPAKLTFNNITIDSIGVRYKGNSSYLVAASSPKKPFKFKFNEYRPEQSFYGLTRLNFSNGAKDPTFMRETIGYKVARKIGIAPRTSFAKIYINGELIGLYTQVEQIDEYFLSKHFNNYDGNLYKASAHGATLNFKSNDQTDYYSEYELKTNNIINDWSNFIHMLDLLNNSEKDLFLTDISNVLDIESSIKHIALCQTLSNFDSYLGSGRNFYIYESSDSKKHFMLPWDLNEAFGCYSNNWDVINTDILDISNTDQRPLTYKILENDSLKNTYLRYIKELNEGPCALDSIQYEVDILKPFLDTLVKEDPNKLYSYEDFITNISKNLSTGPMEQIPGLLSFSEERNEQLKNQLNDYYVETDIESIYSQKHY